jgi:hypothetical protein
MAFELMEHIFYPKLSVRDQGFLEQMGTRWNRSVSEAQRVYLNTIASTLETWGEKETQKAARRQQQEAQREIDKRKRREDKRALMVEDLLVWFVHLDDIKEAKEAASRWLDSAISAHGWEITNAAYGRVKAKLARDPASIPDPSSAWAQIISTANTNS